MFGLENLASSLIPDWATYFLQSQLPPAQIVFTIILIVTFGLIATERLHRTVAALGGAVATLIAGGYFSYVYSWVPFFTYFTSLYYQVEMGLPFITPVWQPLLFSFTDVYKEFVNWSTILIIISVVIITSVARRSGLFEYLIIKVAKFSGGDLRKLFLYIWALTFVLTMLLGNNPTFIVVSVLVFQIARVLDLNPVPYILGTMFVVNAGSSSTVIGGFVNILVSGYYNLDSSRWLSYHTFIVLGLPIALVCMIVSLFFLFHYYRDAFQIPKERMDQLDVRYRLLSFDERILVRNQKIFRRLAVLLAATIAGFIVAGFVGIPFYVVALIFAFAFLFVSGENPERTLREVNWSLVFFFIGIFIVVGGVNSTHVLGNLGSSLGTLTSTNVPGTISLVTLFCGVLSGVLYNISVATAMLYVVPNVSLSALINQNIVIWSLLYGANIGANLTPLGGTPNLIALTSLEREGYHVSWRSFLKIGIPITFVTLFVGIILLIIFSHLLGWGVNYIDLVIYLISKTLQYY